MCKRFFIIYVVVSLLAVPFLGQLTCNDVYADGFLPDESWVYVEPDDQYKAFIAYIKSRDVFVDGSIADAVAHFTTRMYQELISTVGLDMNQLQNELYCQLENGHISKFGYSYLGLSAMNTLFAQFLQNYNLEVGDENVDQIVKSGRWFQDLDGHGCWVYETKSNVAEGGTLQDYRGLSVLVNSYGTPYIYNYNDVVSFLGNNFVSSTVHINSSLSTTLNFYYSSGGSGTWAYKQMNFKYSVSASNVQIYYRYTNQPDRDANTVDGCPIIIYLPNGTLMLASMYVEKGGYGHIFAHKAITDSSEDTDITVTSPKVKPPLDPPGEGDDITVIEPDGTIPEPEPEPEPPGGTVPDWTLPDTQITPIDPENPSGGSNIDWNFQLPDLNIDWNINLGNKFPFCIPGDIYEATTVLSTDPVAPQFSGTIDLLIYQWDFDIDLSMFDSIAVICRNAFFILFVVGLIALSRAIIMKG